MKDLDDSRLKSEIEDIMNRVYSILGKIEEFDPVKHEDTDQNDAQGGEEAGNERK